MRQPLAFLLLLLGTSRFAVADTFVALPQKDNTLYESATGQLSNGRGVYLFAGKTSGNVIRRSLISFDLSSLPPDATITDAVLSMFVSSPTAAAVDISLAKVSRDWGEGASNAGSPGGAGANAQTGDATWRHSFFDAQFWSSPGGDFSSNSSATTTLSTTNTAYSWTGAALIADVQSWVSSPATNFGWVIRADETTQPTAQRFNSRENAANPPQLTITYQLANPTPTPGATATPTPAAAPTDTSANLANIATRLCVGTDDRVMIAGFIIDGSVPKRIFVRAAGPSLARFGVANILSNPRLELHDGTSVIGRNDDWETTEVGGVIKSDQAAEIRNSGIAPVDPGESAIVATLAPGSYTAVVDAVAGASGVAVVEVYDLDGSPAPLLTNLSTRGYVGTGDNIMIGGLIVVSKPTRVILRAVGPSLTQSGVSEPLVNPQLEVHDTRGVIARNDDWQATQRGGVILSDQVAELKKSGLAPTDRAEAAIVVTLDPGSYTVLLRGADNSTGNALLEAYATSSEFTATLPILPILEPTSSDREADYYDVTMRVGTKEILPGKLTAIWGYNGLYPGPTIKARSGRAAVVRQVNNLQESMSVHLHGGHSAPASDGHPADLIGPGASKTYFYANNQDATTLWYHDHAIDVTGRHVYMGLAGFYLVSDPVEEALPLPEGENDIALLIQDRLFNSDGSLNYPLTDDSIRTGALGDTLLVNGAVQPYFETGRRKVRFRILNGSNARIYTLALSSGDSLIQIGSDGGLLPSPVARNSISLAPGERIEVIIDFAKYAVGTSVVLQNQNSSAVPALPNVMRFDVIGEATDESSIPPTLRPVARVPESSASVTRTFVLNQTPQNGRDDIWTINGQLYDPARIDATPKLNATEIWTFQNNSGQAHPMHIHDIAWQILDSNGSPPFPGDDAMKDTFLVPGGGGTVRVIGTFKDNVGTYVSHCHILEHEDHAMMLNFSVQP